MFLKSTKISNGCNIISTDRPLNMTQKLKNTIKLIIWNDLHVTSLCYNSILHYSLLASSFLRGECKSFYLLLKPIELKTLWLNTPVKLFCLKVTFVSTYR